MNTDRTGNEPMTFYSDTIGEKLGATLFRLQEI